MCNTRHVKVGFRSCKTAGMQPFACMRPRIRPTSDIWHGQSRSQSRWRMCVCVVRCPRARFLWLRLKICLEQHLLVEFQGQSLVWTDRWRVLPDRSFEKRRRLCVCGDCCYICVGARHDKKDPSGKIDRLLSSISVATFYLHLLSWCLSAMALSVHGCCSS